MKQFWIQVVALMVVIFASFWLVENPAVLDQIFPRSFSIYPSLSTKQVNILSQNGISKGSVQVEIADNAQKRAMGLGGRDKLDPNSGMLFVFDRVSSYQFWMKGMKIPLDIIWIRGDTVVGISENIPPPSSANEVLPIYTPPVDIDKALEVNAHFSKAHGIQTGDKLKLVL